MKELAVNGGKPVRTKPFPKWPVAGEREIQELTDVFNGAWNRWAGTKVNGFEKEFAKAMDAKHCLAVTNGTVALEVALKAAEIEPGSEVICPAYTFIATATAILQAGLVPVFADIDPVTLNIDPDDIEDKITGRTAAIVPVHLYGMPADMDRINSIAEKHKLFVLEDACQSPGAEWNGRKVGTLGKAGCISFQASKNLNCGEGGAILTNNDEFMGKCFSYHHIGRGRSGAFYEHDCLGTNARLSEICGAILIAQFSRFPEQNETRVNNGRYLTEQLRGIDGISPPEEVDGVTKAVYHLYATRFNSKAFGGNLERDNLMAMLKAEGIPTTGGYPIPLYKNPMFLEKSFGILTETILEKCGQGDLDYRNVYLPETEKICRECVAFPQSFLLGTKEDMDDIVNAIKKIQNAVGK